jgi:membrane-associated phospholipid phosphatase
MKKRLTHFLILPFFSFGIFSSLNCHAQNWDINLLKKINPSNPDNQFWKTVTNTSEPLCVAAPISMFAVSLINHDKKLRANSYKMAGSLVITAILTEGIKRVANRDRPFVTYPLEVFPNQIDETGKSMPSGHTAFAFTTATSLFTAYPKWYVGIPVFAWATSVGYSRLYLGQHYPSDVIVGAMVGTGSALLSNWLYKELIVKKQKHKTATIN